MVRTGLIALVVAAAVMGCKGNTKPAAKQTAKVDEPPPPPPEPRIPAGDAHVTLPKIDTKAGRHVGTATAFVAITKDGTVTQGKVGTGADPYAGKPHTGSLEDELFGTAAAPPPPPPPPADPDDPWAARQQAIDQARQAGILGNVAGGGMVYAELDQGNGAVDVLVLADRDAQVDRTLAAVRELAKHKVGLAIDGGGTPDAVQFRFATAPTTTETPLGYVTFYDADVSVSRPDSRGGANIPITGGTFDTSQIVSTLRPSVMTPMTGEVSVQLARTTTVQQLADVLAVLGTIGAPRVLIAPMPAYDDSVYGGLLGNEPGAMDGGFGYGYNDGSGGTGGLGMIGTGTSGTHTSGTGKVSIGQPNAVGDLDKAIIRRYIKRNIAKITYCYEKQLLADPSLKGTVSVDFFINEDGYVASASAEGMDAEVASCVQTVIEAIEFPKPKGGGGVQVHYPFTFKPAG